MRRKPVGIAILLLGLLAFVWWQSAREAPTAPAPPAAPSEQPAPAGPAPSAGPSPERYDLGRDETRGGHTLARHVGKTDAELFERLRRERGISAASTYADRDVAERTVARTLAEQRSRVDAWLARKGSRPNLALDYRGSASAPIGRSARRGQSGTVSCVDAVVVLRWVRDRDFYVLTSYPEARR